MAPAVELFCPPFADPSLPVGFYVIDSFSLPDACVGPVFAGSSRSFGYHSDRYDHAAATVLDMVPRDYFYFIDDLDDLGVLRTADRIGHLDERDYWRVVGHLLSLGASIAMMQRAFSRL